MFDTLVFSEVFDLLEDFIAGFSIIFAFTGIVELALFILYAAGIYKMGKQLGVSAPWISFIPIVSNFAFGRIASKYIKRDGKKSANFGVWLLILQIFLYILLLASIVCIVISAITIFGYIDSAITNDTGMSLEMFASFIPVIILYVVMMGIAITYQIIYYVAMWRIFGIFSANNADLFIILSIFFPFLYPIFLFVIRNDKPTLTYPERIGFENL